MKGPPVRRWLSVWSLGDCMVFGSGSEGAGFLSKLGSLFRTRELFVHDGASMRRFHVTKRQQVALASVTGLAALGGVASLGQLAVSAVAASNSISTYAAHQAELQSLASKVDAAETKLASVTEAAKGQAKILAGRQEFLTAMLQGESDPAKLAAMLPIAAPKADDDTVEISSLFDSVNQQQLEMAALVKKANEHRFTATAAVMNRLGVAPRMVSGAMGGPYEPVTGSASATAPAKADPQFRALFDSWKKLDDQQTILVSIPSRKPVNEMAGLTSNYGVRSDPFRGGRAMHSGVDIPGAHATPIVATADAIVGRTGWVGGYGNLVELEHGKSIQTRYGHMSSIAVAPGQKIKRGQVIGYMGSTGRSTGTHLHYEVRIEGRAVNPMPFLQSGDYLAAMERRAVAVGGPVEKSASAE
jgi:murein DD-endopeptidase MepM/ murein hydrolase activator NlpD